MTIVSQQDKSWLCSKWVVLTRLKRGRYIPQKWNGQSLLKDPHSLNKKSQKRLMPLKRHNPPKRIKSPKWLMLLKWHRCLIPWRNEVPEATNALEVARVSENREIFICNACTYMRIVGSQIVIVDEIFAFIVAIEIMAHNVGPEVPHSVNGCQIRYDWLKLKSDIQPELNSLAKHQVFGPVVPTLVNINTNGGPPRVFVWKRKENNEVVCFEARLMTQSFPAETWDIHIPVTDAIIHV